MGETDACTRVINFASDSAASGQEISPERDIHKLRLLLQNPIMRLKGAVSFWLLFGAIQAVTSPGLAYVRRLDKDGTIPFGEQMDYDDDGRGEFYENGSPVRGEYTPQVASGTYMSIHLWLSSSGYYAYRFEKINIHDYNGLIEYSITVGGVLYI